MREPGYAVRIHEERHVAGIALPLVDRVGRFRWAVALALPVNRFDEAQLPGMLEVMKRSVKAVDDLLT